MSGTFVNKQQKNQRTKKLQHNSRPQKEHQQVFYFILLKIKCFAVNDLTCPTYETAEVSNYFVTIANGRRKHKKNSFNTVNKTLHRNLNVSATRNFSKQNCKIAG